MLDSLLRRFSYDGAATSKNQRKAASSALSSEDAKLTAGKRKVLQGAARDLSRNFSIAAWAIRKHLDFVSSFKFQSRTGDAGLDREIERLMSWWGRPENCDVAGRHGLPRMLRLAEERRTVDGDVFLLKLTGQRVRGKLQAIESDRVIDPRDDTGRSGATWVHGVNVNDAGRALGFAVHKRVRGGKGLEMDRVVAARNVIHHGFFDRFDQVRGVSPLAPAVNVFRDVYEAADYALAKAKVSQMFGLVFYREALDAAGTLDNSTDPYEVDFGRGPVLLDLEPGDKAEFLESKTPATEFQSFAQLMISVALKSLDIPFSFFDESFTNFYGSRGALLHYQKACEAKRADVRDVLRKLTAWRMSLWIDDGVLSLPAGLGVSDLNWEWIPAGLAWWDPAKEIRGDVEAINAGLRTRSEIRAEKYGDDWIDVVDQLAREREALEERGLLADADAAPGVVDEGAENDE